MPIFRLDKSIVFPPVHLAEPDGLLAVGGDLSPSRLMSAYRLGIFPWFNPLDPLLWWSPDPRSVLFPEELKIHRSMRPVLNSGKFKVTVNKDFRAVITACRETPRKRYPQIDEELLAEMPNSSFPDDPPIGSIEDPDTWITPQMLEAYIELHKSGHAHSVEVWKDGVLAGGLYGIAIGKAFFGESMFTVVRDASKTAFIYLVKKLYAARFPLIDCQIHNDHLESLGAREIPRASFIEIIGEAMEEKAEAGFWNAQLIK